MAKGLFGIQEDDIKDKSLKGKYLFTWVEETVKIKANNKYQLATSEPENFLGISVTNKKIFWLTLIILLTFFIIIARVAYLQLWQGQTYRALAEGNRLRLKPIASARGIIYDRELKELTQNIPNFYLTLIPQDLPTDRTLAGQLARKKIVKKVVAISGVSEKKITDLLDKYSSYSYDSLVVQEDLDYETALKIYLQSDNLPGISIEKGSKRKYLTNNTPTNSSTVGLSHILGYLGKLDDQEYNNLKNQNYLLFDNIGKTGLEKIYETELRGHYGRKKVEVDAGGHEKKVLAEIPPLAGKNLILSLDLEAQAKLEQLLQTTLKKYNKKKAAAIVLNPQDGSILALVSWPTFNNNDFSGGISQTKYVNYLNNPDKPLFNRVTNGIYPSGSTIKMIIAAAALQEGIINYNTTFLSQGGLRVDRWFFPDWLAGGHGLTNVTKAIAWSVNTFFYYIGGGYNDFVGLGVDRITKYLKMFGLGQATGIDLPAESQGLIPDKKWKKDTTGGDWYVGDTYNLSIGQGDLLVTPLQVAVWTAAVANSGKIVQPHLLAKIQDPTTDQATVLQYSSKSIEISAANMATIKKGMGDCVSYGSCSYLQTLSFLAGGKTGTAQWTTDNKKNHAWFTAFAPYDKPQIVVTVLIEEGEEGATTALPVARDFLQWWGKKYLR